MNQLLIYIAPDGKDDWEGTLERPFASLYRSIQEVRKEASSISCAKILIRGGSYYLEKPVLITKETTGGGDIPLVIENYDNEKVIITGAGPIDLQWVCYQDGIYQANIGPGRKIDGLYVNGNRKIMARYPNYEEGKVLGGFAEDALSEERTAGWKNPRGGYIRALHHAEWGGNSYLITGKTKDNQLLYEWVGDNNRGSSMHVVKRMVENIFEELDAPCEWYYNTNSGILYYYPENETELSQAECEIVTTEEFLHIKGKSWDKPVANVHIRGIHFNRTHRTMFTRPYERPLRGDWGIVRGGAVFMENAEKIRIEDCTFEDMGGNAIMMSGYQKDNQVSNCDFCHIGATGVLIAGKLCAVRNASTYDGENHQTKIRDFLPGPASEDYPREIMISDNYFYDIGNYEKQTAAVCMSISESVSVLKNTVHHTSRAGINVHDGTFGGHVIEGNDLFDCVTETADHGPINCWGRDRYWSVPQHDAMGYFGKDKRAFALLDAWKTTVIRGNRVYATYAFGIDIDDGASNYDICNNLCIGVGIKLRDGFDRRVHNNVLIGSNFEHHMSFAYNHDLIYCNIVCSPKICNNVCINEEATTFYSFNTYWNMGHEIKNLPQPDYKSIISDPGFVNFKEGNYEISGDSHALSQGFLKFPMSDKDFGRVDCPKPPAFVYVEGVEEEETEQFYDVRLSNITGEGMRSAAGLPDLYGVFILDRDVLGIFCKLGLPIGVGDVIRKIEGKEIQCIQDFRKAFGEIPLNIPVRIEIYRSQKPMILTFIKQTEDYTSITDAARREWYEGKV